MPPTIKNIIAIILGLFFGGLVNGGIILLSPYFIPPPDGALFTTEEGIKSSMHLMQTKHFIFPFLAHSLGTLVGAFAAAKIAANHKMKFAIAIGIIFLIAGIQMVLKFPAPMWYNAADLIVAYLPMAFIGGCIGLKRQRQND